MMQTEPFEDLICPPVGIFGTEAMKAKNEHDVFENRLVAEELEILKNNPDFAPQMSETISGELIDRLTSDRDLSVGGFLGGIQKFQESAFAGPRGTGEKDELSRIDLKVNTPQDPATVEGLGEVTQSDHR